jgi:4-hydroxy-tetrahydrodipicolinate reductase
MGKVISKKVSELEGFSITAGIDVNIRGNGYPIYRNIKIVREEYDVAIDFSAPSSLKFNFLNLLERKKPIVIASTDLSIEDWVMINQLSQKMPVLVSSNLSLGVHLVNRILKEAALYYNEGFDIEIIEKHHNNKKDSPSGTALLFLETIQKRIEGLKPLVGRNPLCGKRVRDEIGIHSIRGGTIPGEHTILFAGKGETIEITHRAQDREVFADGALKAAKFLQNNSPGLYKMEDMVESIYA